ncbi:putative G-protein coupled receptor CG31760 [Babylonia areolata]|uniref:putative G-protein coupled receptor CG31760 n=1 Tax=Babylonia areolata TaxID=304850 RepID=UPI003FD3C374
MWGRRDQPWDCTVQLALVLVVTVMMLLLLKGTESKEQTQQSRDVADRIRTAKEALNFVGRIAQSETCDQGTGNTLQLTFNTTAWIPYTDPATRTANFLSALLALNNNTLRDVPDITFYNMVRNNVHGETLIFGAGVAFEEDVMKPGRTRYCPYASRNPDGSVTAFDIAESYDYVNSSAVWWVGPRAQDYSEVKVVTDNVTVDPDIGVERMRLPVSNYSHGFWTLPYYDCGGGNIWMVTYLAPVLALNESGTPVFKGIASMDLELTNIDINQCDVEEGDEAGSLDVFRGTHNCQPTTRCVPIPNQGFRRSAYNCECVDGYYFPRTGNGMTAFRGTDIDNYFDNANETEVLIITTLATTTADYAALLAATMAVRVLIVVLVLLIIIGCGALSFITFRYRADMVMKTASPSFLQIMICGAVLMCLAVLLMFPEPTGPLCTIFVWLFHMGISLLYGSLLIKTWRISVIFNSRRKVNLTDKVLLQRLAFIPGVMALCLAAWSAVRPPHVITVVMPDSKKFFSCSFDYWNFSVFGAEVLMLLFGVYLSFTVRKAPAQFNESKYITWSIYNAIIMGVFITIITQIMASSVGPDVLYVLLMLQLQVFDTIALCLIFAPKIWTLHKGVAPDHGVVVMGAAGMARTMHTRTINAPDTKEQSVQVCQEDLDLHKRPSGQGRPSSGLRSNRVAPLEQLSVPGLMNREDALNGEDRKIIGDEVKKIS